MTTLNDVRLAWMALPVHTRIQVLKEIIQMDSKLAHSWARKIPHEMSEFNLFFKGYSPLEIMQIKSNCAIGKKYNPRFDDTSPYFVYNPETKVLTSVKDIEITLRMLFDDILVKLGSQVVIETFVKLQLENFVVSHDYLISKESLDLALKQADSQKTSTVTVRVIKNLMGETSVKLMAGGKEPCSPKNE